MKRNQKVMVSGRCWIVIIFTLSCCVFTFRTVSVYASSPMEQVKSRINEIITILDDTAYRQSHTKEELNKKIRAIAHRGFDWEEISQRSLGLYWRERTQDERKEFTTLFSNLLEDLYIRKVIDNYAGEKVFYDKELIEGNKALIETRVINKAGTEVSVGYRVIKKGAEWVAYDMIIEGVSMVKNYRVQFYTIIRQASYSELVKKLKDKQLAEPSSSSAKETKAVE